MTEVRHLTSEEVADLATPTDYVEAVHAGYRERGNGAPAKPRTTLHPTHTNGMLTGYFAILPESGYMGGYMYAAGFDAGDVWFALPLFDAGSGELLALIDGAAMNPYKTGAVGAVGIDTLAREDATALGIIGSGSQAHGQLLAADTVRNFDQIAVYSPTEAHRNEFAKRMDATLATPVRSVDSPEAVVKASDVLITATTASEPVFDGDWLSPGTHITAMGQYHPDRREIDTATICNAIYVPDLRERAFQDAGAFLQAVSAGVIDEDHIHAELGEVVAGTRPGRTSDGDITIFDSGGTAIETVAAAGMLYERAVEADRGTLVEMSPASEAFL